MKLTRVFFDCDLRCSFEGLRLVAKAAKTDLKSATALFMNKKLTAFKIITNNTYCVYLKNGTKRIPLDALRHLPETFGGSEMEYNSAVETALRRKLNIKEETKWADTKTNSTSGPVRISASPR